MEERYESLLLAFESSETKLWEIFTLTDEELVERLKRSITEIREFRNHYTNSIKINPIIANTEEPSLIHTNVPKLDDLLGGGLMRKTVLEVSGPAGAGKTCLCCQIVAAHTDECVYFTLEENIGLLCRRIKDMCGSAITDKCKFVKVKSIAELRIGLNRVQKGKTQPSLIIIDSIAAALEAVPKNEVELHLEELALPRHAYELNAAIFITNQVRDKQRPEPSLEEYCSNIQEFLVEGDASAPNSELQKRPAEGLTVAQYISTRLILTRPSKSSSIREIKLLYSKWAGPGKIMLDMTTKGLVQPSSIELSQVMQPDYLQQIPSSEPLTPTAM